jgi:UDP-3-O-[3-hydroxymyristoyl] N-acetylglucosamine deacetylase
MPAAMDTLLRNADLNSELSERKPSSAPRRQDGAGRGAGRSFQHTLGQPISAVGIGLHSGRKIRISLLPAPIGHGIVFQRTDLPEAAPIPARYDYVLDTRLNTTVGDAANPDNRVATVEHLMAALRGCDIDNALVLVDGPEIPAFDGSAQDFVFLIDCAGQQPQTAARRIVEVIRPVRVEQGESFMELLPNPAPGLGAALDFSLSIDFPVQAIGRQTLSLELTPTSFRNELSRSRTFTFKTEIDALHQMGLALGGSLDNAIVVDGSTVLNPAGLRSADEFIRHKMMDAVGDLAMFNGALRARVRGHRPGHALNNLLLRRLFADRQAWRDTAERQPAVVAA